MIVDHQHKVAYCYIAKNSCSTWKAILANITSGGKVKTSMSHDELNDFHKDISKYGKYGLTYEQYNDTLSTYTKLLIVRHPMDRLVSAYLDKVYRDKAFKLFVMRIAERYRLKKLMDYQIHTYGQFVTKPSFKEFLRMIVKQDSRLATNEHWDQYFFRCNPCHIDYDYVLKVETMEHDMQMFLSQVYNIRSGVGETRINSNKQGDSKWQQKLSTHQHLNPYQRLKKAFARKVNDQFQYENDFFGYSFNSDTKRGECSYSLPSALNGDLHTCC